MTQIFQDIFGPKLVKENLIEKESLDRLPSPQKLQGMIILKGRVTTVCRLIIVATMCLSHTFKTFDMHS